MSLGQAHTRALAPTLALSWDEAGQGTTTVRVGMASPQTRAKNSKYPEGTPLTPNFLCINHFIFYTTFNVKLKSFNSFLSYLAIALDQLLT